MKCTTPITFFSNPLFARQLSLQALRAHKNHQNRLIRPYFIFPSALHTILGGNGVFYPQILEFIAI